MIRRTEYRVNKLTLARLVEHLARLFHERRAAVLEDAEALEVRRDAACFSGATMGRSHRSAKTHADAFNAGQPQYSTIKKFTVLDHDLSQEGGELTPTSKVKRNRIVQLCQPLLDAMYGEKLVD